jgi:Protein of unknown function (DUF2971)
MHASIPRPQFLYKYRALSPEKTRGYTQKLIQASELYLARVHEFNDPFDSRFTVDLNASDDDREACLRGQGYDDADQDQAAFPREEWARTHASDLRELLACRADEMLAKLEPWREAHGICAFSEIADNVLMWSHYAGHHCGVCLRFDVARGSQFFEKAQKVEYTDEYPTVRVFEVLLRNDVQEAVNWIRTKAKSWAYEQEWRIVRREFGVTTYPSECLTGIILGCCIDARDRDDVISSRLIHAAILKA